MRQNGVAEPIEDTTASMPPDGLDAGDRDYHGYVTRLGPRLAALEQQRQAIANEIQAIQGARQSWGAYLAEKYGLPIGTDVLTDGTFKYPEGAI